MGCSRSSRTRTSSVNEITWNRTARSCLYPIHARARGNKQCAAVFSPGQVGRQLGENDAPEQGPVGPGHPYTSRPRAKYVALKVDLHPVWNAGFVGSHVEQEPAFLQCAVRAHVKRADLFAVRVVDIENRFIRRECQPVRQREVIRDQLQLTTRRQAIDTIARLFLAGNGSLPPTVRTGCTRRAWKQGVGRVREGDSAVRPDHDVVRAVQSLALEPLRQHGSRAVVGYTRDAT